MREPDSIEKGRSIRNCFRSLILDIERKRNWPKEAKGREELLFFSREPKEHSVSRGHRRIYIGLGGGASLCVNRSDEPSHPLQQNLYTEIYNNTHQ